MSATEVNTKIVEGYLELLGNLSIQNKLDLIAKLSESIKGNLPKKNSLFKKSFGAFESEKTAEQIIEEIRNSRVSNRQIEPF
jgi:hypothetical protein